MFELTVSDLYVQTVHEDACRILLDLQNLTGTLMVNNQKVRLLVVMIMLLKTLEIYSLPTKGQRVY